MEETRETKFCTGCGREIDVTAAFCTHCGTRQYDVEPIDRIYEPDLSGMTDTPKLHIPEPLPPRQLTSKGIAALTITGTLVGAFIMRIIFDQIK